MKTLHLSKFSIFIIAVVSIVIIIDTSIAYAQEKQTPDAASMGPPPVQNSSKRYDIKVEFAPTSIVVNPVTNVIYTSHTSLGDSVSVISGKTNKTISVIKVGTDPGHIAVNPITNMIYVANLNSHSVSVISGLTNKVVDTIDVGEFPRDMLINTKTNTVYIGNEGSSTISVIDGKTNSVVATIPVCNISGSESTFAIDPTGNTIYVTCTGPEGAIDVISGVTNKLIDTIPVGHDPTNVVFNPNTHMLYTANNGDYTVSVVSAKTDKVVITIPVELFPTVVAINPDTNMIYVANNFNSSSNKLSVIDGMTNKVVAKVSIGSGVQNIAIDSSNNIIYVVNYASNSISVISGKTNTLIDTIPVGALPTSIAINNVTSTVYVANWRSDFVSMIPVTSLDLQTIPEWKSINISTGPFTESAQSANNFDIQYRTINGTDVLQAHDYTFVANTYSKTNGMFEIKIPRNFPYYNGKDGPSENEKYIILENGADLTSSQYDKTVSDCLFTYSIPFYMNSTITVESTDTLYLMTPIYGDKIPDYCMSKTMVPEFPYVQIILIMSIMSTIVFYRVRFEK
ncbi:MAG: YncE family protein [Thaumarchaeota archaeon]|nr:YncE family protein [Nitrososphaerota archaeon]